MKVFASILVVLVLILFCSCNRASNQVEVKAFNGSSSPSIFILNLEATGRDREIAKAMLQTQYYVYDLADTMGNQAIKHYLVLVPIPESARQSSDE